MMLNPLDEDDMASAALVCPSALGHPARHHNELALHSQY